MRAGRIFNLESEVENLESYVQLSRLALACESKQPTHYMVQSIFREFLGTHDWLERLIKKTEEQKFDPALRDRVLSQMLSLLQIPTTSVLTPQEKQALIQTRLDQDLATIRVYLKPEGFLQPIR